MFTLHLDLHVHFVPPMTETGKGLVLTREVQLPFAPVNGQRIFSRAFDECPYPGGCQLEEVVWDTDRQVFLASSVLICHDFPMPEIPGIVRTWIDMGWRLGSYLDTYPAPDDEASDETNATPLSIDEDEWADAERAHLLTWKKRTPSVNRILKALIRHMVETYDNETAAYAFDATGRYFSESDVRERVMKDPHVDKFAAARRAYVEMSSVQQEKWRRRTRRYPSLEQLISDGT